MRELLFAPLLGITCTLSAIAAPAVDPAQVEEITGLKGAMNEDEGVFKVSQARTDVKVSVDGWQMPPFMGSTSRAAFIAGKEKAAMVMGDLVLFQDEVNPVMSTAFENGVNVTALSGEERPGTDG